MKATKALSGEPLGGINSVQLANLSQGVQDLILAAEGFQHEIGEQVGVIASCQHLA